MQTMISIPVDTDIAQIYQTTSQEQRQKIQLLLSLFLHEIGTSERVELSNLMDEISDKAEKHGLTSNIIDSILSDGE
jgi:hypothetical protein